MFLQAFRAGKRFLANVARKQFGTLNGVLLTKVLFESFRMLRCERTIGHRTFFLTGCVQFFVIGQTVRLRKGFVAQIASIPDVSIDVNVLNVFFQVATIAKCFHANRTRYTLAAGHRDRYGHRLNVVGHVNGWSHGQLNWPYIE